MNRVAAETRQRELGTALPKKNPPLATGPSQGGNAGKISRFAEALCVAIHTCRRISGSRPLADPQIFRGCFSPVLHLFVAHLGTLVEAAQAGSFYG
jgi:hypothetical protein